MASFNLAIVMGNLTRNPERRQSVSGTPICTFTIATNYYRRTPEGERISEPEFHECTAFNENAEHILQYMRKGSSILVQGPLKTDRWEDSTGVKRQRTYIIVQRVVFGSKRDRAPGEDDEKWPYPQPDTSAAGGTPAPVDDDVPF